jgi:hypothetical protein
VKLFEEPGFGQIILSALPSTASADRVDHRIDLRFLAVDGGVGAKQRSFHGLSNAGRGKRRTKQVRARRSAAQAEGATSRGHVRRRPHAAAPERGCSRKSDADDDAKSGELSHDGMAYRRKDADLQ